MGVSILAVGVVHVKLLQQFADGRFLRKGDCSIGTLDWDDRASRCRRGNHRCHPTQFIEVHVLSQVSPQRLGLGGGRFGEEEEEIVNPDNEREARA